jgi:hypothetical protein
MPTISQAKWPEMASMKIFYEIFLILPQMGKIKMNFRIIRPDHAEKCASEGNFMRRSEGPKRAKPGPQAYFRRAAKQLN